MTYQRISDKEIKELKKFLRYLREITKEELDQLTKDYIKRNKSPLFS